MSPLSPTAIRAGGASTLVGQVRTARQRTKVTISRKSGDRWFAVATVTTGKDGSFAANVRPRSTTTYRASCTGDVPSGPRLTKTSWPVTVRVK